MNKIVITSDSGIDPINIDHMIPAQIIENDTSYRDIIEITSKEIIERTKNGSVFRTSSPLIGDYDKTFKKILEDKKDVIHLSMSSGISEGSVNTANLVANDLNEIYENQVYVVDTLNGATGGTLISAIASNLVSQGFSFKEVITKLEQIKKQIVTSFYVPDPKGFIRSGRNKSELCTKDKAILMGIRSIVIAGIKFRVDFNDEGNLYTKGIFRSSVSDGMIKLMKRVINENNKDEFDSDYIVVGNVNESKVSMEKVIDYIDSLNYFKNIINQPINGVVAAYGSDDLCGVSLIKKI